MRRTAKHQPKANVKLVRAVADETSDTPFEEGAHDILGPDMRHRMISETAYHLYTERGYRDGYDVDDWLEAEARVDHLILKPKRDDEGSAAAR